MTSNSGGWVREAFQAALERIDNDVLVKMAGRHVLAEGEWTTGRLRPSLLADSCQLSRVKKFLGHGPQPGARHMASRNGLPSATTNLVFARGFLAEGLIVGALKLAADSYPESDADAMGLDMGYDVVGCAPELTFACETELGPWEAHPDLVVMRDGEMELVQIKCPSVFAFERHRRGDSIAGIKQKYGLQVMTEMYAGRQMGWPVQRAHIFLVTWEGNMPGSGQPDEIRTITVTIEWSDDYAIVVEEAARQVVLDAEEARNQRVWPKAYDEGNFQKWPCSYCQYPRVALVDGQATCTENEKWENQR